MAMHVSERITVRLHRSLRTPWAYIPSGYRVIGTIYRGLEFGFLSINEYGDYVQVNGSVVQPLNQCEVDAAISAVDPWHIAKPAEPLIQPVVKIRKSRRIPALEDTVQ